MNYKLNFDADELFVKAFLGRLIQCVKPIAILDKAKIDEILAEMKKESTLGLSKELKQEKTGFDFDVAQPKNILSFRSGGKLSVYQSGFNYNEWVVGYLKDKHEIFSIQNSLGEILTVGNLTGWGIIERFDILTEGTVFASGKYNRRTKKLVVYCSERNFVWIDPKEVSSIADKEMPKNKYPEGVLRINFATGYSDGYSRGYDDGEYQKWCKHYLSLPSPKITLVKNSSNEVLAVGDKTQFGLIESFSFSENGEYIQAYFSPTTARSDDGRFINIGQVHPVRKEEKKYPEGIERFYGDGSETVDRDFTGKELEYQNWVASNLNQGGCKIVCVKNKHGEVLTVGGESNYGKILYFKILDDQIFVGADKLPGSNTKGMPGIGQHMNGVHPLSKGIVTKDGFAVDKDDGVWFLNLDDFGLRYFDHVSAIPKGERGLLFKGKKNAEKYVDENKPQFSAKEIETQFGWTKVQELYAMRNFINNK